MEVKKVKGTLYTLQDSEQGWCKGLWEQKAAEVGMCNLKKKKKAHTDFFNSDYISKVPTVLPRV